MVSKVPRLFLPHANFQKLCHKKRDTTRTLKCTILKFCQPMYIGTVRMSVHKSKNLLNGLGESYS